MSSPLEQQTELGAGPLRPDVACQRSFAQREPFILIIGLGLFFLLNLATADKTPAVWCDEVMYQDPAVNLFQDHGFCSGAWFAQDMNKFWAGNVPLYQFVLFGWLKVFGFSLQSVRSMHYALVGISVLLAWLAVRRLNLIAAPLHRLFFCAILCLSSASTFVYRSARPESLGICLVAFTFLAFSFKPRWLRLTVLTLMGILLTWCGLQLAVLAACTCAVAMVCARRALAGWLIVCAGCALGGGLLFCFTSVSASGMIS